MKKNGQCCREKIDDSTKNSISWRRAVPVGPRIEGLETNVFN
jgi:hypothetical protein